MLLLCSKITRKQQLIKSRHLMTEQVQYRQVLGKMSIMKVLSNFQFFISFMLHLVISELQSSMPLSFIQPKNSERRSPYRGKYYHMIRPELLRKISASSQSQLKRPQKSCSYSRSKRRAAQLGLSQTALSSFPLRTM